MAWTQSDKAGTTVPYVYQPYPKAVKHVVTGADRVVADEAAWALLGAEWGYEPPVSEPEPPREVAVTDGFTASQQDEHDQPVLPRRRGKARG